MFRKKIPVGRIIPSFSAKVQNLTVFSFIYMIRIRFFGPGELIKKGFRAAQYMTSDGQEKTYYAAKMCKWEHQLCHDAYQKSWSKDWKSKVWDSKSSKRSYRQHRIHWTVGMKSTSLRFKVSVLMNVLLHRHHLSAEWQNQQSVICHKLGGDSELFLQREHVLPKAASKLAAAPSAAQASISKNPVTAHNSSIPTASLPIESTEAAVTVPDNRGSKKREAEAIIIDMWPQPPEFRSWKISFKSEVCHPSQYRRAAMPRIGEAEDPQSIGDLINSASFTAKTNTGLRESWLQECKWTQEDPNWELQETSHHSRRQSSIREEITYRQTDFLDDLRLLRDSWRQWSHLGLQKFIDSPIQERQRSGFSTQSCQQSLTGLLTANWRVCARCKLKSLKNWNTCCKSTLRERHLSARMIIAKWSSWPEDISIIESRILSPKREIETMTDLQPKLRQK